MSDTTLSDKVRFSEKGGLKAWLKVFRIPFHSALVFPFILGAVLAWSEGYAINWLVLIISTLAVILATSNCFLTNEYFDYETDWINREYNRFTGGSRVLPEGRIPRDQVFKMAIICGILTVILGLFLQFYFKTGFWTIPLGALAVAAGYFYTAKPIQLAYRGFGELFIGLTVGGMTVFMGYYLQTQNLSLKPVVLSLPWVVAVTLLIWVNEFPDYASDKASGKKNLVVRLGKERAAIVHQLFTFLMWLLFIAVYFYFNDLPLISMVLFLPVFILSFWNVVAFARGDWRENSKMEKICFRQIVYSILMLLIFIVVFIWRGLS